MNSFWDKVCGVYDISELTNKQTNDGIKIAVEREVPQGARVLDCAAGTGMLTLAAAKKASLVRCTDMSKGMLVRAMKKARRTGVYNVSFARRDVTALKEPDNAYDVVMAGNVLHLLSDPGKAFAELVRVTKKGGKIIVPTYLLGESSIILRLIINLYKLIGFSCNNDFSLDGYLDFIAANAEAQGCREYRTELIYGTLPAGLAVITK